MGKRYILDTNIILDNPDNLIKIHQDGENEIIVPEVVIDELDAKKSGFDDINYNARQFARLLEESEIVENYEVDCLRIIVTEIKSLGIKIKIVSKKDYKCDNSNIATNILNDRKILEVAHDYNRLATERDIECVFLSLDIMARTRALSLGIDTEPLRGKDADKKLNFHKEIFFEDEIKDGTPVTDIDQDYKPENFSYTIKDNAYDRFYYVENEHLFRLPENVGFKRESGRNEKYYIKPMNTDQKFFVNALCNPTVNILAVDAKAGSGKTLLTIGTAMSLVRAKQYNKIIYIRNSIESVDKGEDVGYLPGLEEKFAIYNHPLHDSLKFIARNELKKSNSNKKNSNEVEVSEEAVKEKCDEYMSQFNIETAWVGELRGRTLTDAFVVIDEGQNMSGKTMQLVLSRIDQTCKVAVLGSNKQIDNLYTNKYVNGLSTLLKACENKHDEVNVWAGELNKVLRGPITEFAEKIFSR